MARTTASGGSSALMPFMTVRWIITSEISRQVFPIELDIDHPKFKAGLDRLRAIGAASDAAKKRGGVIGWAQRAVLGVAGVAAFARLYCLPMKSNALPDRVLMAPAW